MTAMIHSASTEPDSWCRHLGNFRPVGYSFASTRAALAPPRGAPAESIPARGWRNRAGRAGTRSVRHVPRYLLLGLSMLVTAALLFPLAASAQMQGGGMGGGMGGHGGHGSRGGNPGTSPGKGDGAAMHVPNPLRAMLGEVRQLRSELLLTADQIGAWSAMEDALRQCVELNRSRMPVPGSATSPDALAFTQELADNERALADATAKFAASMKVALAALNARQLQTTKDKLQTALDAETAHIDASQ